MGGKKKISARRHVFRPTTPALRSFSLLFTDSMMQRLLLQAEIESGWHSSPSDENPHLSIKNALGVVVAHCYRDGGYKMVPTRPGGTRMANVQSLSKQRDLCLQISRVLRRLLDELARTEGIYVETYAKLQHNGLLAEYLGDWKAMTEEFRTSILSIITTHLRNQHVPYITRQCKEIAEAIKGHQGYTPNRQRGGTRR